SKVQVCCGGEWWSVVVSGGLWWSGRKKRGKWICRLAGKVESEQGPFKLGGKR
nr:hypothetical protein [Tanacetum cinerariifolium]